MTDDPIPECICGCRLTLHGPDGRCHGLHGMAGVYCECWCFRRPGEPTYIRAEPDWSKVIRLLEAIEYGVRRLAR